MQYNKNNFNFYVRKPTSELYMYITEHIQFDMSKSNKKEDGI